MLNSTIIFIALDLSLQNMKLLTMLKQNKCFKNKFRYLFFHLKILPLLLLYLRFEHHFLDMVVRSVGQDLVLANLSGSGSLVNLVKYKHTQIATELIMLTLFRPDKNF